MTLFYDLYLLTFILVTLVLRDVLQMFEYLLKAISAVYLFLRRVL